MREIRCFVERPLAAAAEVELPEAAARHLLRVLRLGEGSAVTLFNGDGLDYMARIVTAGRHACSARIGEARPNRSESPLRLTLLQGVARGEKMDLILQKACELGVAEVLPVLTERTEVRLQGERAERRHAHWLGVLRGAAEQSGRARVPALGTLRDLGEALSALPEGQRLLLSPSATVPLGRQPLDPSQPIQLLIGPEGGLGERDLRRAAASGFEATSLGPRILRTETAGLVALTLLQARLGDLV